MKNNRISFLIIYIGLYVTSICSHQHESHKASANRNPNPSNKMHSSRMSQDLEHIVEHLKEKINVKKEMSHEELEFHYFM